MIATTHSNLIHEVNEPEFLPFARPFISEEAIHDVVECLRSGWITTGPRVQTFEAALRSYCQTPHALTVSHATAGLFLALKGLNLQPGDEVITTPMTFVCTANVIVHAGGKPVFVDIDEKTYNLDINLLEGAITPHTRAIIPVHFDGLPVDLDPLYALATQYNLRIIEDAAHAIGAEYKGKRIGSFGDTQVFSFHPNKNMTTGEGGCITTRDERLAHAITLNRFHGIDRTAWNRFGKSGTQNYDVLEPGYKFNLMDLQAALGLHQLKSLDSFIEKRTQIVQQYYRQLEDWTQIILPEKPCYEHKHAWHQFAIRICSEKTNLNRDQFIEAMKEQNIGTGLQFAAVHLFSFYKKTYGYKEGDFPIAEKVGATIVSLPLFPLMTNEDQNRVITAMKKILAKGDLR